MAKYVGLDVSQRDTHVCVLDEAGQVVWRGVCASTPSAIAETVGHHAPEAARIGLETGPLAIWHFHGLKALGLPAVCIDARHARAALSARINKTDENDAQGIAELMRVGWFREVAVKSLDHQAVRAMLGARAQLVGMRTNVINQMRGILKVHGVVLAPTFGKRHERMLHELCTERQSGPGGALFGTLSLLLSLYRELCTQVVSLTRLIGQFARSSPACRLLMTIPGVGAVTAAAFVATIDDPQRFRRSHAVGAYLGMTPRRHQSGEMDRRGRISRCGDGLTRSYLFEAATSLLTRSRYWSALRVWGLSLAKRTGMKKAKVATARKLAAIMHRMWLSGEPFRFSATPDVA